MPRANAPRTDRPADPATPARAGRSGGGDAAARPFLEVQIHAADIRKGVRYVFLTRKQVVRIAASVVGFVIFVLLGLLLAPAVVGQLTAASQYRTETAARAALGVTLRQRIETLGELNDRSGTMHREMAKIYLAYGFSLDEADIGQGGYPAPPATLDENLRTALARSPHREDVGRGGELETALREQMAVLDTFLDEVQSFEASDSDRARITPSISPLRSETFVLTSPFGNRRSPFTNELDCPAGIDRAAPVGTPISAPADGAVAFAGRYPLKQSVGWWRYGNLVAINHGDRFTTLYGHCDEVRVQTGQRVNQGDVIATVGNTGWSTNPHLHYEVRRFDGDGAETPVDPRIYILDHRWRDEELLLVRARSAPDARNYEPLPRRIRRTR
ncbi:MAG: M23 family metallopeptidase [Acidobacteriota bacterium]